jgi:hypothetical protein
MTRRFAIPVRMLVLSTDAHSWTWRQYSPEVFRVDLRGGRFLWVIPLRIVRGTGPAEDEPRDAAKALALHIRDRAARRRKARAAAAG